MLPETTSSDLRFPNKNNLVRYENISISTLNIRTLSCDVKLANTVQEAKNLGIDILALQEVIRRGDDDFTFESKGIEGWQFVWSGFKRKLEAGVAFILAPHVKLIGTHFHYTARILSVRVIIHGLCLSLTCCYAPTDTGSESSKTRFIANLEKLVMKC
jgi:exonuclease III